MKRQLGIVALLGILLASFPAFALDLMCNHITPIQMRFLARHVYHQSMNRNLEARTVEQFIKHLDSSKLYLTDGDEKKIKTDLTGIFDKTRQNDCSAILKSYDVMKTRVKERAAFAKQYLSKDFKFDPSIRIQLDAKKRGFAKSEKEAQEFQKKYVQLQVANYLAAGDKEAEARDKVLKNYDRAIKRIDEEKPGQIFASYLDSFASALDPHSTFWSQEAYEDFEISIRLSLEGIGATLSSKDGFTVIEQLLPGGAADRSGQLKPKDIITAVGQGENGAFEDVFDQDLRDVVRKIRGPKGTKVRLQILRKDAGEPKKFQLVLARDKIAIEDEAAQIHYVDREVGGKKLKIALLNLPSFYADSRTQERSASNDVRKLLRDAREKKADALVLDLSSNGGGSLQDAVDIAGFFFKEGNVVKQSSREAVNPEITLFDKDPFVDWSGPLVVLTSRMTASASEIVSGTLKDYRRAVIVGADHTFGKGTVQAVEDLPQRLGGLKTTIGLYFIPGGHSTQHIGILSDIELPSALSAEEFGEKTLDYSLPPKQIKPFLSAEAYVPSGRGAWTMIDKKLVDQLKVASAKRVAAEPEFKKVKDELEKAKKKTSGEVVLSELVKDREEDQKEIKEFEGKSYAETQVVKKEKYLKRADIQETINIAADLATLEGGGKTLILGAGEAGKPADSQVKKQ